MPSIKDKSTVQAIAREFCSNGRNAYRAMIEIGYSKNYADRQSDMVMGNVGVKRAIANIDAKSIARTDITIDNVLSELKKLAMPADDVKVPNSDRLRSLEMLGKYLSMFSESGNNAATGLNLNFSTKPKIVKISPEPAQDTKQA